VASSHRASVGGVARLDFRATPPETFSARNGAIMGLVLTSAPAVEPVTVDEVKSFLRIDHDDENSLLASLITSSRLQIEAALDLALITQSWSWTFDSWPKGNVLELPIGFVRSVEAVRITARDGTVNEVSPDQFVLEGGRIPPRLLSKSGDWPKPGIPALGIEIAFTAGFGSEPSDVPEPIRQALLMLVAHWYEHRDPAEIGGAATRIPEAVSALLKPYSRVRL